MRLLEMDDIWVVFDTPNGHAESLRGAALKLDKGEWVAVIGHNGSGKSTLGRVIAGLCDISKGQILVDGLPCTPKTKAYETSLCVRIVFQSPDTQAVGDTVMEDVAFQPGLLATPGEDGAHARVAATVTPTATTTGAATVTATVTDAPTDALDDEIMERAAKALSLMGLWEVRGQPVETLSGGQKQRLAIASAIVAKPDILVLDEVTTMLDDSHREQVWDTVRQLNRDGVCIVWITQNLDELWLADAVVVMDEGKVAYQGDPRSFFYSPPSDSESGSICERMGFVPPFAVAVAKELGDALAPTCRPLTVAQLMEVIHP